MFGIEKLKNDYDPGFNKRSLGMEIRAIKDKLNEIIDVVNDLTLPDYTADVEEDDDNDGEPINVSNLKSSIMSQKKN